MKWNSNENGNKNITKIFWEEWFLFYSWYILKDKCLKNIIIIFLIHSNIFTHKKAQIKNITILNENFKFSFEMHWKNQSINLSQWLISIITAI